MLKYEWNKEKDKQLRLTRGIGFEDITTAANNRQIIVILKHSNPLRYKNQNLMIIKINNYAYCVPFVEGNNKRFLKTIYPSRKYTKIYLKGGAWTRKNLTHLKT